MTRPILVNPVQNRIHDSIVNETATDHMDVSPRRQEQPVTLTLAPVPASAVKREARGVTQPIGESGYSQLAFNTIF